MRRSAVPAVLVVAAALADTLTLHEAAFYLLVAAVPAGAVAALVALGDLLDGAAGDRLARCQVVLSALGLVWIVIAAAIRSTSIEEGSVPPAAVSALVVCLVLFGAQALASLGGTLRPRRLGLGQLLGRDELGFDDSIERKSRPLVRVPDSAG